MTKNRAPARLFIATTEGPSEVQRITPEDPDLRSVACLDGKALALPISPDYDAFVRAPTGVVEACFGHGAFRVDLSHPVTEGLSWQMALFTAHAMDAAGRLAVPGAAPDRAVWMTGEVDRDLRVLPVDRVADKLRASAGLFADLAARRLPLLIVLPTANMADLTDTLLADLGLDDQRVRLLSADGMAEVLAALNLPPVRRTLVIPRRHPTPPGRRRLGRVALVGSALALAALGAVVLVPPAPPAPTVIVTAPAVSPSPAPAAPALTPALTPAGLTRPETPPIPLPRLTVTAEEQAPPAGDTCAAVHFSGAQPQVHALEPDADGTFPAVSGARPCGLSYRVTNDGDAPLRLWVLGARRDGGPVQVRALARAERLAPGATLTLDALPPRPRSARLDQRLALLADPAFDADLKAGLDGLLEGLDRQPLDPDRWAALLARLAALENTRLVTVRQEFRP